MAKKVRGKCCICGKEATLSFEHIPPKSAFNKNSVNLYDFWGYMLNNNSRYEQKQGGVGRHSLCQSCNNLTGEWYGAAYAEFADQGMKYFKSTQEIMYIPFTIYPLRVFKQIVSCFASTNGNQWCENNPQIRKFLLDRYERNFPSEIDIKMYMQKEGRSKISGISGQMNVVTGERFMGSEWGFPPFSFIYVADKEYSVYDSLNGLYSIRGFLEYEYDEVATIDILMPRKPCNPTTLDFRESFPSIESIINSDKNK